MKLSIRDLDLSGKRVFIRVDFNVPIKNGVIGDDTRVKSSLPTIKYALDKGATVILASHLGRPKGKPAPEFSLRPVATHLAALLGRPVIFAEDCVGEPAKKAVAEAQAGSKVVLLENLRFHELHLPHRARPRSAQMFGLDVAAIDDRQGIEQLAAEERPPAVPRQRRKSGHRRPHASESPEIGFERPDRHDRRRGHAILIRDLCEQIVMLRQLPARVAHQVWCQAPLDVRVQVKLEFGLRAIALDYHRQRFEFGERRVDGGRLDPACKGLAADSVEELWEGGPFDGSGVGWRGAERRRGRIGRRLRV